MHKEPDKKMIGLFMAAGIAALLAVLGIYVKEKLFESNRNTLVMYFEESIKGLNVGSSVVFKGVEIGKVAKIDLIASSDDLNFSIPVYVKLDSHQGIYINESFDEKKRQLNELIEKGLRARLTTQSYLTGQLIIELEMMPGTPIVIKNKNPDSDVLEIPTVLSPMGELSKGFQAIPIRQSVEKFNDFLDELNKQLPVILPQISQIVNNVNNVVKDNRKASADTIDNLNKAINNISEAAKAMRNFADYIERHPEALLKGKRGY